MGMSLWAASSKPAGVYRAPVCLCGCFNGWGGVFSNPGNSAKEGQRDFPEKAV